ncbi:MAG: colanic acid biosynthesis glycosyltransferase WcaL [Hyphococcus sp.]|nr:MAG: colanic acid biosynthesis glycosyltransferase WcaL [Marinicaulis sp.]
MRVAYFVNQYPGISHSFVRREIQALERQSVDVVRYAIRPSKDDIISDEDRLEFERTRHIVKVGKLSLLATMSKQILTDPVRSAQAFLKAIGLGWRSEAGLIRHLMYFGEALVLASWLKQDGIRHVHAHFGTNTTTIALLAAPMGDATFSFTAHGPEEFEKADLISLREKIETADFTVAISKFGASQLKKLSSPAVWDRIKIVHCGIEPEFYETPGAPHIDKPVFVCVGRLCAEKGQIDLVNAASIVAKKYPALEVRLIGDGPMRGEIEKSIEQNNLESNVSLLGWKTPTQVRNEIVNARAFVLPSYAEGLPVSIMEALSLRRPVISTFVAGIPELIETGKCGWLTPAGDVEAIASAMLEALGCDGDMLSRMGEDGLQRVKSAHDIDQEASRLIGHFQQAMESAK